MYFFKSTAAASALLVSSVYGHAIMSQPVAYGFHTLQTSPLNGDNFKFPCQSGSRADAFDATGVNNPAVQAGGFQPVSFTGAAVHGSGSCQFSVTYDFPPPSDPSKWKVIHTIIGGCPSDADGNIDIDQDHPADQDGRPTGKQCKSADERNCLKQFQIPIPKQLPNGKATFAWTWFNDIGNREIYMNCAPIEVQGGSNDKSFLDTLPQMFVANLPGFCTTVEGILNIPNPGQSVQQLRTPEEGASGTCPKGGNNAGPPPPTTPEYTAPAPSATGGIFAPGASSAPAVAPTVAPVAPEVPVVSEVPSVPEVPVYPTAPVAALPVPTGAVGLDKVACSNEGGVVCMGSDYFGLCDHGFAVKMAVALGTKCENGKVLRRSVPRRQHLHARIHGSY